jgi:hypothetical protein
VPQRHKVKAMPHTTLHYNNTLNYVKQMQTRKKQEGKHSRVEQNRDTQKQKHTDIRERERERER